MTAKIRALIIDDEPLAREGILTLLNDISEIEVVAECGDGVQAISEIRLKRPDLIFLDIQMPGVNGFDVLRTLDPNEIPVTIFVTAFDQYALDAFNANALDYVLKPIDPGRFHLAVRRAIGHIKQREGDSISKQITEILSGMQSNGKLTQRIAVKSGGRIYFVKVPDIDWIGAAGDYVCLHVKKEEHLIRETMNTLEKKLDRTKFVRIHRSTIVNIERIKELHPMFHGEFKVRMLDESELVLSRSYREQFEKVINKPL